MKRSEFLTHEQQNENVIRVIFGFFLALSIIFTVFVIKNIIEKDGFLIGFSVGLLPFFVSIFLGLINIIAWTCKMKW